MSGSFGGETAVVVPMLDAAEASVQPTAFLFAQVYNEHFDLVWRSLHRLGVPDASVDDAVQDVFVVVYRQLNRFEGRSSLKTWLFAIALRVARDYRRRIRRRGLSEPLDPAVKDSGPNPHESAVQSEALRLLKRVLERLDDDKRAVFILAELEQMTAPEIADALGIKLNTVYSRLRAARHEFNEAFAKHQRGEP